MMKGILCETAETYGWNALTDLELLTIVTGSKESASVLREYLSGGVCSVEGLLNLNIEGIGRNTAMKIKALYSLFTRPKSDLKTKIKTSSDIYKAIAPYFNDMDGEAVYLILINANSTIKKIIQISKGSFDQSLLDVRMVAKYALESNCSVVALAHNHPGGSTKPSALDINATNEIYKGCKLLRINLVDHIIVSNDMYYSFSDDDKLE